MLTKEQKITILLKKYQCYYHQAMLDGFTPNVASYWQLRESKDHKYELNPNNRGLHINPFSYFFIGKEFNINMPLDDYYTYIEIEKRFGFKQSVMASGFHGEVSGNRTHWQINSEEHLASQLARFIMNKFYGHRLVVDNSSGIFILDK